jgi:ATPase subunit of ABC transporter with duplicated ATPase domains
MDFSLLSVQIPEEMTPNRTILEKSYNYAQELSTIRLETQQKLLDILDSIEKKIKLEAESWKTEFGKHDIEYKRIMEVQGEQRVRELNDMLEDLNRRKSDRKSELVKIEAAQKQYNQQIKNRVEHLGVIKDRKQRIAILRERKAKEIVASICELQIVLIPDGNHEAYKDFLSNAMTGSRAQSTTIESISNTIHPLQLAQFIREGNSTVIDAMANIGPWSQKLIERFRANPENIYRLESIPVEDYLEISFEVEEKVYRSLDKLSTGQKATVIVLLSMIEGASPIIFDQPEDALYTPFIYSNIVRLVRGAKEKRQFIFATHNSNIAVASDLDLGIVLEGTSTATSIQAAGGLDDTHTKNLVVLHLEGGEPAIKARLKEYQIKDIL